jgi:hypothetical protein
MLTQGPAVIGIVHMVIIDRREPNQQDGSADEGPRVRRLSEDLLGIERMAFHRKGFSAFQPLPGEVARFCKGAHLARRRGKLSSPGHEPAIKEVGE